MVCISDTHTFQDQISVPYGDIIVHAGDATFRGERHEVMGFAKWYRELPHTYKVFVAGNHDLTFEKKPIQARAWLNPEETHDLALSGHPIIYLQDEGVELDVDGQKIFIYGSPWQPEFFNWAFNLPRGEAIKNKWDKIPDHTDVLVTHGPPYGVLDKVDSSGYSAGNHVGCEELREAIRRTKPIIHVCGHIHEGYGEEMLEDTLVVNASICTDKYKPTNDPLVFDIYEDGSIFRV